MPFGFGVGIVGTNQIADGAVTNAKVNAAAAIAEAKLNIGTLTAHVAAAAPHSGYPLCTNGTYTGNAATGRAIPHGLGRTPKMVVSFCMEGNGNMMWLAGMNTWVAGIATDSLFNVGGTPDATNFYVGSGAAVHVGNYNTNTYYWVAFG